MPKTTKTIIEKIESNMRDETPIDGYAPSLAVNEVLTTIRNTMLYFETYIFPNKVEIIKQKYLNAIDRTFHMRKLGMKNRSNRVYPLIASVHDTFVSNLHEVETTPRIVARTKDNQTEAPTVQGWYDWARDVSGYAKSMMPIRSEACLIGTSYGRSGFTAKKHDINWVKSGGKPGFSTYEEMKPTIKHVSFFQLFYDVFSDSFEDCPWKAYRYISDIKNVNNKYAFLFDDDTKRINAWKSKIKGSAPLSAYDYTRIYASKNYEKEIMKLKSVGDYDNWVNNKLFTVNYSDHELVEVIEYWEDDQLIIFINGIPVYEGSSPYPFTGDPFSILINEEVPGQIQGIGVGDKLINHQNNANLLFSGLEDFMRMHLYPMYKAQKGALVDTQNRAIKKLSYEPEKVVEDASKLGNGGIETIKWVDFNMIGTFMQRLQSLIAESYEIVGLNTYTQGGNGKMERSAQGVTQKAAIIRTRLLSIIESLNSFNARVFSQWLAIGLAMFPETFNYRVIGEDGSVVWDNIKLEDVVNKFDVVAESEAMRAATKELKASQAIDALSKIAPINIDPLTGLPIYHIESFMEDFMGKFDFEAPKKYTEGELIKLVEMKARIDAAARPPSPEPGTDPSMVAPIAPPMQEGQTPGEVAPELVNQEIEPIPSDMDMLAQMQL